jgi:hypothetical protein
MRSCTVPSQDGTTGVEVVGDRVGHPCGRRRQLEDFVIVFPYLVVMGAMCPAISEVYE